jgi:CheY-like chemotaxis protein
MPNGGNILVEVRQIKADGSLICIGCHHPLTGLWIAVTVTDTGEGIPAQVMPHIFEPFFTTKEVGKGSGLGLAQVYGIVKQHNGHITVTSQPNRGTDFTIYLPPAVSPPPIEPPPVEQTLSRSQKGETILVVEDELGVLEVTKAILEYVGYQVLTATNGQDGIEIYRRQAERIALVISDMVMPDMKGTDLFMALKAHHPALKLILMSGYPLGNKEAEIFEQGVLNWMQKPVSMQHLTEVVSQALNGA